MGVAAPAYYPADMVRVFPEDGNKYEIVHGEPEGMNPVRHLAPAARRARI